MIINLIVTNSYAAGHEYVKRHQLATDDVEVIDYPVFFKQHLPDILNVDNSCLRLTLFNNALKNIYFNSEKRYVIVAVEERLMIDNNHSWHKRQLMHLLKDVESNKAIFLDTTPHHNEPKLFTTLPEMIYFLSRKVIMAVLYEGKIYSTPLRDIAGPTWTAPQVDDFPDTTSPSNPDLSDITARVIKRFS